ncbi:DNA-binding response regulator [Bacilli bacterium]|nr:transcriptional regulator [Bacilli bacterium VT-13-104]PZD87665.1 DNA-binding response regulator [Bacilli bacterium]PZD90703.1 DNA-binding response regulator [Bacilli bacterium]PZD91818.1 DNA-binding response regulator [Bacilli bacterium]RCO06550.1 DNA-binding response regulator [Bacilli bacterium]
MNQKIIMVIDDEEQMRKMIRTFLEKDGYTVVEATNGSHALSLIDKTKPDLLLVDVMMPFMDGFTFAQEVKRLSSLPLIFLSAKGEEWDKVHGLKLGGDDYIVKPFLPGELLARIESVLRRTYGNRNESDVLIVGPLLIDYESYQVRINDTLLSLTRKEFGLLNILAKNSGRVYSREQLLHLVWGDDHKSSRRTVDTHIKTLRLKMGDHGNLIETVWGIGYKFEV